MMSGQSLWRALLLSALVALGSALGACLRALLGDWLGGEDLAASLWSTGLANASGAYLIGWLAARTQAVRGFRVTPALSAFLMTGFCGGYTTLSLFSLDLLRWLQVGEWPQTAFYALSSLAIWLAATAAGWYSGRQHLTR